MCQSAAAHAAGEADGDWTSGGGVCGRNLKATRYTPDAPGSDVDRRARFSPAPIGGMAAMVAVGFVWRLWLIHHNPFMPLGDSYGRLVMPTELVKAGWLPGYQATLALLSTTTREPEAFRVLTAVQSTLAAVVAGWAAVRAWGGHSGVVVALALSLLPTFVLPSTALYQEPLFLLLAVLAVRALSGLAGMVVGDPRGARQEAIVVTALGACCLVRYEGWLFTAAAGVWLACKGRWRAAMGCALVPVVWLAVARSGTLDEVKPLDNGFSPLRVVDRVEMLGRLAWRWRAWPIAVPAVIAAGNRDARWLVAGLGIDVVWLGLLNPFSPSDNPRQLILPLAIMVALAARFASPGG